MIRFLLIMNINLHRILITVILLFSFNVILMRLGTMEAVIGAVNCAINCTIIMYMFFACTTEPNALKGYEA